LLRDSFALPSFRSLAAVIQHALSESRPAKELLEARQTTGFQYRFFPAASRRTLSLQALQLNT
jgi:hypothetical protein